MPTTTPSPNVKIPAHIYANLGTALPALIASQRRCVLYSAGSMTGQMLADGLFQGTRVEGIADRNASRFPGGFHGFPVVTPDLLAELDPEAVLICSPRFHLEIVAQLMPWSLTNKVEIIDLCATDSAMTASEEYLAAIFQRLDRLEKIHTLACLSEIDRLLTAPRYQDSRRLEPYGYRCYSQHDEDGMLAEVLRRLGPATPRTFVEFGVGDGLENNTLLLIKQGWRGLWMDGDPENAKSIRRNFATYLEANQLTFLQAFISRENINELLGSCLQGDIGVLSIDIDGNDYHVWERIDVIRAAIVVIEYNAKFPPPLRWTIEYNPLHQWDLSDHQGASLAALAELGQTKGYQLVGCNLNGTNAFFVRKELVGEQFLVSDELSEYYHPPRYYLTEGYRWLSGHRPDPRAGRFW